jgi:hypothetical protein
MRVLSPLVVVAALALRTTATRGWTDDDDDRASQTSLEHAQIIIEFNATDGDVGIQAFLGGTILGGGRDPPPRESSSASTHTRGSSSGCAKVGASGMAPWTASTWPIKNPAKAIVWSSTLISSTSTPSFEQARLLGDKERPVADPDEVGNPQRLGARGAP